MTPSICLRPPTPQAPKPLPYVEPLGCVRVSFVKAYDKRSILKASAENQDDAPVLYIDLEHPRPEFTQMKDTELHLGISANFRVEPQHDSSVKPHIDIYIPKSEIHSFLRSIIQANLIRRHAPRHNAMPARPPGEGGRPLEGRRLEPEGGRARDHAPAGEQREVGPGVGPWEGPDMTPTSLCLQNAPRPRARDEGEVK